MFGKVADEVVDVANQNGSDLAGGDGLAKEGESSDRAEDHGPRPSRRLRFDLLNSTFYAGWCLSTAEG